MVIYCRDGIFELNGLKYYISALHKSFYLDLGSNELVNEYREWVAVSILSNKPVPEQLSQLFAFLTNVSIDEGLSGSNFIKDQDYFLLLKDLQCTFYNYLDSTSVFAVSLLGNHIYLKTLSYILSVFLEKPNGNLNKKTMSFIEYCIGGIYNALHHEDAFISEIIQRTSLAEIIKRYTNFHQQKIEMAAYMFLAYTTTEKDELLIKYLSTITKFVDCLSDATCDPSKKGHGYSTIEITKALAKLAQNDNNKKALVDGGILPCLKTMVMSDSIHEVEQAINLLWILSFQPENKENIVGLLNGIIKMSNNIIISENISEQYSKDGNDGKLTQRTEFINVDSSKLIHPIRIENLTEVIKEKKWGTSPKVDKYNDLLSAVSGLIRQLKSNDTNAETRKRTSVPTQQSDFTSHLMISYNRNDRNMAMSIAKRLRELHINVWIDKDNMRCETDILQGMANAVENSFAVCILYSKAYKESPHTRNEAEYAHHLGKPLIFVRVQPSYVPDGWLGIMLATSLYLDFSGKYPFDEKMEELYKKVEAMQQVDNGSEIEHTKHNHTNEPREPVCIKFSSWDISKTSEWLKYHKLKWNAKDSLTGKHLEFLCELKKSAPNFFYDSLRSFGGLNNLQSIMEFVDALSKLSTSDTS